MLYIFSSEVSVSDIKRKYKYPQLEMMKLLTEKTKAEISFTVAVPGNS